MGIDLRDDTLTEEVAGSALGYKAPGRSVAHLKVLRKIIHQQPTSNKVTY